VARFSGHRTPAVFKRYNIVEEQDLKAAVAVLNRARKRGHEVDTVDEKYDQKHEGPAS
jgi:hypothetical protein